LADEDYPISASKKPLNHSISLKEFPDSSGGLSRNFAKTVIEQRIETFPTFIQECNGLFKEG